MITCSPACGNCDGAGDCTDCHNTGRAWLACDLPDCPAYLPCTLIHNDGEQWVCACCALESLARHTPARHADLVAHAVRDLKDGIWDVELDFATYNRVADAVDTAAQVLRWAGWREVSVVSGPMPFDPDDRRDPATGWGY